MSLTVVYWVIWTNQSAALSNVSFLGVAGTQLYYGNKSHLSRLRRYAEIISPFLSSLITLIALLIRHNIPQPITLCSIQKLNQKSGFSNYFNRNIQFLCDKCLISLDGVKNIIIENVDELEKLLDELILYDCQIWSQQILLATQTQFLPHFVSRMANQSIVQNCGEPGSQWIKQSEESFFLTLEGKLDRFYLWHTIFLKMQPTDWLKIIVQHK